VLLITMDTTRADHIGCYGDASAKTPSLDRLAASGILFERAYTTSVLTLPSHASILTGLLPPGHAVRDNGTDRLHDEAETLAEIFGRAGYRTGAFVSSAVLEAMYGLDQGFSTYDDATTKDSRYTVAYPEREARSVTDAALAWLREAGSGQDAGKPWLLWVHYFDPHSPYKPPAPWEQEFAGRLYDGEIAYMDSEIGRLLEGAGPSAGDGAPVVVAVADHGEGLGDHGEISHGVFLYDESARIPLIMKVPGLPAGGMRVSAVVSSVSILPTLTDLAGLPPPVRSHGTSLRPLWEAPGAATAAAVSRQRADGGDETFPGGGHGVDHPGSGSTGGSGGGGGRTTGEGPGRGSPGAGEAYTETIMPATMYGWSPLASLRSGTWKYIHGPHPELYAMEADPGERADRLARRNAAGEAGSGSVTGEGAGRGSGSPGGSPGGNGRGLPERTEDPGAVADRMRRRLEALIVTASAGAPATEHADPSADQLAKLRSLGYVSGSGDASFREALAADPLTLLAGGARGMIDPKARADRLIPIERVMRSYGTGHYDEAVSLARALLEENPGNLLVRRYLAAAYRGLDRLDESLAEYMGILDRQGDNTDALIGAGWILMRMNRLDEARALYERVVAISPRNLDAVSSLGSLELIEGNLAKAEERFRKLLEARPNHIQSLLTLSRIAEAGGRLDEAIALLDRVLAVDEANLNAWMNRSHILFQGGEGEAALRSLDDAETKLPGRGEISYARGNICFGLGRLDEAAEAFGEASRRSPQAPQGWYGMGMVAARKGDRAEARRLFGKALQTAPDFAEARAALDRLGP
jgi:arylsulfatase A-like enzyme/tetratricopeptide (TPR) repeat protein